MTGVGTGGCATINQLYFKKNRAQQNKVYKRTRNATITFKAALVPTL